MNYYDVLGVSQQATTSDIRKAYRDLALQHHPDKNSTNKDEEFKLINEAYNTLINNDSRREYDQILNNVHPLSNSFFVHEEMHQVSVFHHDPFFDEPLLHTFRTLFEFPHHERIFPRHHYHEFFLFDEILNDFPTLTRRKRSRRL